MAPTDADRTKLQFVAGRRGAALLKLALGLGGLLLFVFALQVVKASASGLGGILAGLGVTSPWNALGLGWILACLVLSGSPVAAIALTFFAGGLLDDLQAFLMIAGSRFGAAFVVLLLAFLYTMRRRSASRSLEMGVLSLLTTYAVYGVAIPLGALVLLSGSLDGFRPALPPRIFDAIDVAFGPSVGWLAATLHPLLVFALGLGAMLFAFHLFDRALPDLAEESPIRGLEQHVYRPIVMFGLGAVITLFTLSVSVSLGLLVPLSAKGIARRENVIPYIMGANITTFVDTLFATLLLDRPEAFTIVLVELLSVAAVSVAILFLVYARFERLLLATSRRILASPGTLTSFIVLVLLTPVVLMLL